MNKAAEIQRAREAEELALHKERIVWLTQPCPLYACGAPVDTFTKRVLLSQSKAYIEKATGQKGGAA